jgi:hypothetical protein
LKVVVKIELVEQNRLVQQEKIPADARIVGYQQGTPEKNLLKVDLLVEDLDRSRLEFPPEFLEKFPHPHVHVQSEADSSSIQDFRKLRVKKKRPDFAEEAGPGQ